MNTVVDEVLAGDPRYKITYNDNSTATGVKIDLETAVTTQGTALNKALFDSIQSDITSLNNNKLNVSAKATQSQAEAGTNNTNYMTALRVQNHYDYNKSTQAEAEAGANDTHYTTPLKVQQKLNSLRTTKSGTNSSNSWTTDTIIDFTNLTNKTILLTGWFYFSSNDRGSLKFNYANGTATEITSAFNNKIGITFTFDTTNQTITGLYRTGASSIETFDKVLTDVESSITSVEVRMRGTGSNPCSYSMAIQQFS